MSSINLYYFLVVLALLIYPIVVRGWLLDSLEKCNCCKNSVAPKSYLLNTLQRYHDNKISTCGSKRMMQNNQANEQMTYDKDTITMQTYTYERIRKAGGKDVVNDVYVRNPKLPNLLWFVGKVARCTGTVTLQDAVTKQWNLIQEHAAQIRPLELGRDMTLLEVWCAPGDSEVEMEENKNPSFQFTKIEKAFSNIGNVALVEIGFKPELVTSRGETFRVERTKEELNL